MEKTPITKDTALNPGEKIEIHFDLVGTTWLKAAQIALIEKRLAANYENFRIEGIQVYGPSNNSLKFIARVITPPAPIPLDPMDPANRQEAGIITAGVIIAAITGILAPIVWYFSLKGIFKIADETGASPIAALSTVGTGAIIIVVLIIWLVKR